jgi:hypothetical protein
VLLDINFVKSLTSKSVSDKKTRMALEKNPLQRYIKSSLTKIFCKRLESAWNANTAVKRCNGWHIHLERQASKSQNHQNEETHEVKVLVETFFIENRRLVFLALVAKVFYAACFSFHNYSAFQVNVSQIVSSPDTSFFWPMRALG